MWGPPAGTLVELGVESSPRRGSGLLGCRVPTCARGPGLQNGLAPPAAQVVMLGHVCDLPWVRGWCWVGGAPEWAAHRGGLWAGQGELLEEVCEGPGLSQDPGSRNHPSPPAWVARLAGLSPGPWWQISLTVS